MPIRSSSSFRWNWGWVASPLPCSSGPSASHSSLGNGSASQRPGSTTKPFCIEAMRARRRATAGADVVMPAAIVNPPRRLSRPPLNNSPQQDVAPLSEVDRSALGAVSRATARRLAASLASECSQCLARSLRLADCCPQPRGIDLLDQESIKGSPKVRREAQRLGRPSSPGTYDASVNTRSVDSIAGAIGSSSMRSNAPPIRSSSSGSPIGISRGSSRPPPLARRTHR